MIPPQTHGRRRPARATQSATALLFVAIVLLSSHRVAGAIQASGSVLLVPSKQTGVIKGETFSLDVYVQNDSMDALGNPVSARLQGPLRVTSFLDPSGAQRSNLLQFVPGPAMGCAVKVDAVRGCAAGLPGEFLISLDPAGLTLPAANEPLLVATIALYAPIILPKVGLRASTPPCGLEACGSTSPRMRCTSAGATGGTFVSGIAPLAPGCRRRCKGSIEYGKGPLDRLSVKGEVEISDPNFDPSAGSFTVELKRGTGPSLVNIFLPGGIPQTGPSVFSIAGPGNPNTAGIDIIRLTSRGSGKLLLELEFYGDLDGAESYMPLEINIAGTFSTFFEYWKPRPGARGWVIRKAPR